jgi:hypothetical protein
MQVEGELSIGRDTDRSLTTHEMGPIARKGAIVQDAAQMNQGAAERRLATWYVAVRPEEGDQFFARVDATLDGQVGEERQRLARRKDQRVPRVVYLRQPKHMETQSTHVTLMSRLCFAAGVSSVYGDACIIAQCEGGGVMAVLVFVMPILPGKAERWRRLLQEVIETRRNAYEESRRRLGITRELAWIAQLPQEELALVYLEAADPAQVLATISTSAHPFDRWFREQLREVHGQAVIARQYRRPNELVFAWYAAS